MIKGLSERRRLPRLGKIRLGVMVQEPGKRGYPKATDYFVVTPEVEAVFGHEPKRLDVMFPVDDPALIFPQEYKLYKTAGLWCAGDGERAKRWDERGELRERACPCEFLESGECGPVATLSFLMPDVPGVGVWQLVTGNQRSITSINTSLETFSRMFGGLRGVPFTLHLEEEGGQRYDDKSGRMVKQTFHVLRLDSPYTIRQIIEWRGKQGAEVAALMPAPEPDDVSARPLPAEPEVIETPQPMVGVTPEAGVEAAPASLEGEWDVSVCFSAARRAGFPPETYGAYLQAVYRRDVDNLTPEDMAAEAAAWQQAQESELAMKTRKSVLVARLRKVGAGQERLL